MKAEETAKTKKRVSARENRPAGATTVWQDFSGLVLKVAGMILVILLLFTFLYGIFRCEDPSMFPAIKTGDLVLYYRMDKEYVAGETIALTYEGELQARRIVAIAGDVVDFDEGGMKINGAYPSESNIYEKTERLADGINFPVTVGEGEVFVLGDGREEATDSRIYGPVKVTDTLGKVMTIIRRKDI